MSGLHGFEFVINLHILFLIKGHKRNKEFRLSSNNKRAGYFDDLVYEENNETVLVEAKHAINKQPKIHQLFSTMGSFSLLKYLQSFVSIENYFTCDTTHYILCTNAEIDYTMYQHVFKVEFGHSNELCNIATNQQQYSFDTDATLKKLQELTDISKEVIKTFLRKFRLIVIQDKDVQQAIEDDLKSIIEFDKYLFTTSVHSLIREKIRTWIGRRKAFYLTSIDLQCYLYEASSFSFISSLTEYYKRIVYKEIHLNPEKRLTIIKTSKYLDLMFQLYIQLSKTSKNLLFVNLNLDLQCQQIIINTFMNTYFTHLVIAITDNNSITLVEQLENALEHLEYKNYKTVIVLANVSVNISPNLVPYIFDGDLNETVSKTKYSEERKPTYLERKLTESSEFDKCYTENEFLNHVLSNDGESNKDVVLLISGLPGEGKSSTLSNLSNTINSAYTNLKSIKIVLSQYYKLFQLCIEKNISLELEQLLDYASKKSVVVEKSLLKLPDSVVLMLDGLDNVSFDHFRIVFDFIQNMTKTYCIKRIIISTREHMETFIENEFNFKTFWLKPLVEDEQYQLMYTYLTTNLNINEEEIDKINTFQRVFSHLPNFISQIPLFLKIISNYFIAKAKKRYCLTHKDAEINISTMYDILTEEMSNFNRVEKDVSYKNKDKDMTPKVVAKQAVFDQSFRFCQSLALQKVFTQNIYEYFEKELFKSIVPFYDLYNTGLLNQYLCNTIVEYFAAKYLYGKRSKSESKRLKYLITNNLNEEQHTEVNRFIEGFLTAFQTFSNVIMSMQSPKEEIVSDHLEEQKILKLIIREKSILELTSKSEELPFLIGVTKMFMDIYEPNVNEIKKQQINALLTHIKAENNKPFVNQDFPVLLKNQNNLSALLQLSCLKNIPAMTEYILGIGVNPNSTISGIAVKKPIEIAIENHFYEIFKILIEHCDIELPEETLITLIKSNDKTDRKCCNYLLQKLKTTTLPLNTGKTLNEVINKRDKNENTALHYAVLQSKVELVNSLLDLGACLGLKNENGVMPIEDIQRSILEDHFDSCIKFNRNDNMKDDNFKVTFNYETFLPPLLEEINNTFNENEDAEAASCFLTEYQHNGKFENIKQLDGTTSFQATETIYYITKTPKFVDYVEHPVIVGFLISQWNTIGWIFDLNTLFYFMFLIFLTVYVFSLHCKPVLIIAYFILIIKELFQIVILPLNYWKKFENYVELILITLIGSILVKDPFDDIGKQLLAVSILLAGFELILMFGQYPEISKYVNMLKQVSYNFLKLLLFYCSLIIAFAFSFHILSIGTSEEQNKGDNLFLSVLKTFFRTVIMTTGEFDSSSIKFDESSGPVTTRIIFSLFIFMIFIVLMNLLTGLAVSDIQTIEKNAKLNSYITRAEQIYCLEKTLLKCRKLLKFIVRMRLIKVSSIPNFHVSQISIFPNVRTARKTNSNGIKTDINNVLGYITRKIKNIPRVLLRKNNNFPSDLNREIIQKIKTIVEKERNEKPIEDNDNK